MCWTGSPTGQLHKCGYKELFHRQLYQDLTGSELPEGVDIHHQDGNPANNMAKNLEPMPRSHAISQHFHVFLRQLRTNIAILISRELGLITPF